MQLPNRRKSIVSKVVPKSKPRSSVVEAVILEISKGMQKLKKIGGARVAQGAVRACRDSRICRERLLDLPRLGTPRWRL